MKQLNRIIFGLWMLFSSAALQAQQPAIDSLQQVATSLSDTDTVKIQTLIALASLQTEQGNYKDAIINCKEAYRLAKEQNRAFSTADAAMRLGSLLGDQSQHKEALGYLQESARLYEKLNERKGTARALNNIAAVYQDMKDYKQAINYMFRALKIMEKLQEPFPIAIITGNIGNLYNLLGQPDKALVYVERSLALHRQLGNKSGEAYALNFLGGVYEKMNKTSQALKYYLEALEIEKALGNRYLMVFSYNNIGEKYMESGNYALAEQYLEDGIKEAKQIGAVRELARLYNTYAMLDSIRQDFRSAFRWHRLHKQYSDSVFNTERSKQVAELQAAFDLEVKENEIQALEQEAAIQQLALDRRNALLAGSIIIAVLLIAVVYIFLNNKQLRTRYDLLLAQQRWRRAQMNPHFFFNALAAVQDVMVKDEPKKAGNYIAKFSRLMRQTLEQSEKEFTTLDDEIVMLTNYLDLQKLRFGNKFDYVIEQNGNLETEELLIPVMLLQPLVENAVEHGLKNIQENGLLRINFTLNGDQLIVVVEDNGVGRDEAAKSKSARGHVSMSSQILESRLELLQKQSGYKAEVRIEDKTAPESGTKATFFLPIKHR
ncbi:tetratricopeptide repeat-containing sensor histidine kinase [Rhodoflexus caldus]|uniref:tetratricopeptide repeat-containing sensor histidine kinase n=1 Tax=Rhodoflexus caldus TaxID=2891236 RepID=UPI00202AB6B6|nr:tetratricopeptide repeat protein [Rhodoflexus caldus]